MQTGQGKGAGKLRAMVPQLEFEADAKEVDLVSEEEESAGLMTHHTEHHYWRVAVQVRIRHRTPTRIGIRFLARCHSGQCSRP